MALAAVGASYVTLLSGLATVVQLRAPAGLRARILSLYMVSLGSVYPLGAVLQGAAGDRLGLRAVTAGCAAAFLLVVVAVGLARPDPARSLDDPAPDPTTRPSDREPQRPAAVPDGHDTTVLDRSG